MLTQLMQPLTPRAAESCQKVCSPIGCLLVGSDYLSIALSILHLAPSPTAPSVQSHTTRQDTCEQSDNRQSQSRHTSQAPRAPSTLLCNFAPRKSQTETPSLSRHASARQHSALLSFAHLGFYIPVLFPLGLCVFCLFMFVYRSNLAKSILSLSSFTLTINLL